MWIERLELSDFRCFESLTVAFHPELTVLVANNGGGKSSVLDALAIAFSDYVFYFFERGGFSHPTYLPRLQTQDYYRVSGFASRNNPGFQVSNPSVVALSGSDDENRFYHKVSGGLVGGSVSSVSGNRGLFSLVDKYMNISHEEGFTFPVLARYGTDRNWKQIERKAHDGKVQNYNIMAYEDCLYAGRNYISFLNWFEYIAKVHADERMTLLEKHGEKAIGMTTRYGPLIEAIRKPVDLCLQAADIPWQNLSYNYEHQEVVLEHPEYGVMELNRLSDGIRNTIALVADIALRCVRLNRHLGVEACLQTNGIVMIDEIDLHLHPSWQQRIIPSLRQAFPKVQFIVTTHSPQVLSTVDKACIRVLDGDDVDDVLYQTEGVSSADILAMTMNVNPVPDIPISKKLSQYKALIQQGLHEKALGKGLYKELVPHFGEKHPEIMDCQRLVQLASFKRKAADRKATTK